VLTGTFKRTLAEAQLLFFLHSRQRYERQSLSGKSRRDAVFVSITGWRQTEFALERSVESRFRLVTNVLSDFRDTT
jgi:hypothetical protein